MEFTPLEIPDVILIRPRVFADSRGYFFESWQAREFAAAGLDVQFVQENHSHSVGPILRGLHYQTQQTQGKLVRAIAGTVFDVAVDMRRSSPTFGRWGGTVLSEENHHMLWVPPGFAHGFFTLSDSAHFLYRCSDYWAPAHERTVLWNDPDLGVKWPLAEGVEPVLSPKDAAGLRFREAECFP